MKLRGVALVDAASFDDLVREELGDEFVEWFEPMSALLTEPCVIFEGWGADSRRMIYLGKTDAHGEYPVITIDTDDGPFGCINGPVDVWLAQQAGFLDEEDVYGQVPAEYEEDRQEHARLSFDGFVSYADGVLGRTLDPFGEEDGELEEDEDQGSIGRTTAPRERSVGLPWVQIITQAVGRPARRAPCDTRRRAPRDRGDATPRGYGTR